MLFEEIAWRQKSRELWLKEGEQNTKFFYKMVNAHKRRNFIISIKVNRLRLSKDYEMNEGVANVLRIFY